MNNNIIKIFGANAWHDNVSIIGNKEALEKLKQLIDSALEHGFSKDEFMESDGEGFNIEIAINNHLFDSDEWIKFPVHYIDEMASEKDKNKWDYLYKFLYNKSINEK
jgi:hypothetical protein